MIHATWNALWAIKNKATNPNGCVGSEWVEESEDRIRDSIACLPMSSYERFEPNVFMFENACEANAGLITILVTCPACIKLIKEVE